MTIEKAIEQLEDLKRDRAGFAKYDEPDGVFAKDIKAINTVIKYIGKIKILHLLEIEELKEENNELKRLLKMESERRRRNE